MESKNIFQIIAEGIANTNQNVVDLYKVTEELSAKVDTIHAALYPGDKEK
jgi:hypothetical protein